jgi:hypothetical protein
MAYVPARVGDKIRDVDTPALLLDMVQSLPLILFFVKLLAAFSRISLFSHLPPYLG